MIGDIYTSIQRSLNYAAKRHCNAIISTQFVSVTFITLFV